MLTEIDSDDCWQQDLLLTEMDSDGFTDNRDRFTLLVANRDRFTWLVASTNRFNWLVDNMIGW